MKSFYKNSIDNEMAKKLKSLEVAPPSGLWNEIESTLNAKARKRIIAITSCASAATLALFISIGGYLSLQPENQNNTSKKTFITPSVLSEIPVINNIESKSSDRRVMKKTIAKVVVDEKSKQYEKNDYQSSLNQIKPVTREQNFIQEIATRKPHIINAKDVKPLKLSINKQIFNSLEVAETKKRKGDLYISASGFPIYSFHSAGFINKTGAEQESGLSSFGGSISIRYEFANRFSIETGLSLGFMGQKEKDLYLISSINRNTEVYQNNNLSNSFGTLVPSNPEYTLMQNPMLNSLSIAAVNENDFNKIEAYQRFRYLEIPLTIAKGLKYKKINLFIKGGVSAGMLINNTLDLKGNDIHLKGKTQGVDKFSTTAIASIGIAFPIYNKLNLIIEPSFKIGIKPLQGSDSKTYPFSSYVKCGVEIPI